ncbi:hypothetical protein AGR1C_pAt20278 [Agrobacterium fabacearum TT111]|nr:hypothetical protein AGR1C_pAt20278 [Agrobacterium fabacearum TT111]
MRSLKKSSRAERVQAAENSRTAFADKMLVHQTPQGPANRRCRDAQTTHKPRYLNLSVSGEDCGRASNDGKFIFPAFTFAQTNLICDYFAETMALRKNVNIF